jgi:hypothetical protein
MKSPLAKARDKWFRSEDGKRCLTDSILIHSKYRRYLKYRLECAFLAGAQAHEKILSEGDAKS